MNPFPYQECRFIAEVDGSEQSYLLLLPPHIETADTLVLAFHGHGSHQEQFMTPEIYWDTFGKLTRLLRERNVIYATPEYRFNSWMGPLAEADVTQIIAELRAEFSPRYVVLVGGSMGGGSVLTYAALHPEGLDGVYSMCPATDLAEFYDEALDGPLPELAYAIRESYGGTPEEVPDEYDRRSSRRYAERLTMPVSITHGNADALINVSYSRTLVERLTEYGAPVYYLEIEAGDHDSPAHVTSQQVALLLDRVVTWKNRETDAQLCS